MHVSELRLPDPLDERESLASGSGAGEIGHRPQQCSGGGDGYSECGMSDDHMSLPSSAGLSQLSLLTGEDDNDDDSENVASHQRAGMPVASSSISTRLSSPPASLLGLTADQTRNTRKHTASLDTYSDVGSSYSIISNTLDCPSPSYSITGVRTTPQTPPLRSSPSAVRATVNDAKQASVSSSSSLPTNLKEYIDTLSAAEKQTGHDDEHQKNFDMWLKSVTPYSQRTMGSDDVVSVMSSLGSPLPPSVHPASLGLVAPAGAKSNVDLSCLTTRAGPLFADRLLFLF